MKIYAIIASLFLMVGCAHSSGNSSAVYLDGTWKGEMNYRYTMPRRGKPKPLYFNFKKTGDSIKGTVDGRPMEDIEIKSKKITFSVTRNMANRQIKMIYKGKIKGDKITLSSKAESPPRNIVLGNGLLLAHPLSEKNYFTLERVSNEPQNPVE